MEVFLDRRDPPHQALAWPTSGGDGLQAVRNWLDPFLDPNRMPDSDPEKIAALVAAWRTAPMKVRRRLRISRHFGDDPRCMRREDGRRVLIEWRATRPAEIRRIGNFDFRVMVRTARTTIALSLTACPRQ